MVSELDRRVKVVIGNEGVCIIELHGTAFQFDIWINLTLERVYFGQKIMTCCFVLQSNPVTGEALLPTSDSVYEVFSGSR